jgi:hypothetical protein
MLRPESRAGDDAVQLVAGGAEDAVRRRGPSCRRSEVGDHLGVAQVDPDHPLSGALEPLAHGAADSGCRPAERDRALPSPGR